MVMDLLVRGRKRKSSLDDIMRDMYEEFYLKKSEQQLLPAWSWLSNGRSPSASHRVVRVSI